MQFLNYQGSEIEIDSGFRYGNEFFNLLNFLSIPNNKDANRNSLEQQCYYFYRDIMNYDFVDSHNQHLQDGRFDLAAKNLNAINKLSLDKLTGLRRKEFSERKIISLENEVYEGTISDFSLIICDLDKFKEVNDKFGHSVGDETLSLFGKLVLESLRPSDFAYRYGGEEFLFLLPETSLQEATTIAERIRLTIKDRLHLGHYGLNKITAHDICKSMLEVDMASGSDITTGMNDSFFLYRSITCSFGVSNYSHCSQSVDSLFANADEKLYMAKSLGRDKVVS
ncbi:GGDEF domain-containing protein [Psychromonas sp. MME1]|uniref:GGDEF domain-containing protein n=1 Tax=Psychromonas sp. MME1 TaxID=3231032 RepID=UPI0034E21CDB